MHLSSCILTTSVEIPAKPSATLRQDSQNIAREETGLSLAGKQHKPAVTRLKQTAKILAREQSLKQEISAGRGINIRCQRSLRAYSRY